MLKAFQKQIVQTEPKIQNDGGFLNYDPYPLRFDGNISNVDLVALKDLIIADSNAVALLKGANGTNGNNGVDGNKIIVLTTDPLTTTTANIGDFCLNSTSGTLFQKSAMTQTEFFNSGLQGLVLSNAVWIIKGNLKGSNGTNGANGTVIQFLNTTNDFQNPILGDIAILNNSFDVYLYSSLPVPGPQGSPILYANTWDYKGSLKGATGAAGANGTEIKFVNSTNDFQNPRVGDVAIINNSFDVYLYSSLPVPSTVESTITYADTWNFKGNLKGINGTDGIDGTNGTEIKFVNSTNDFQNPRVGDVAIINNSFDVYLYSSLPLPEVQGEPVVYAETWDLKGTLKGPSTSSVLILQTQDFVNNFYKISPLNSGKTIVVKSCPANAEIGFEPLCLDSVIVNFTDKKIPIRLNNNSISEILSGSMVLCEINNIYNFTYNTHSLTDVATNIIYLLRNTVEGGEFIYSRPNGEPEYIGFYTKATRYLLKIGEDANQYGISAIVIKSDFDKTINIVIDNRDCSFATVVFLNTTDAVPNDLNSYVYEVPAGQKREIVFSYGDIIEF